MRSDGNRQNGELCAADDRYAGGRARTGANAALADPRANARARDSGGGFLRALRQASSPDDGALNRRRKLCRSRAQARSRRRRADRDPGAPSRPLRTRQDPSLGRAHPGDRRGGPDARHGVHPRCRADRRLSAGAAPDTVFLRNDAGRDPQARRRISPRPSGDRGGTTCFAVRDSRAIARSRPPRRQARSSAPPDPFRRRQECTDLLQPETRRRYPVPLTRPTRLRCRGAARRHAAAETDGDPGALPKG